jgi:hypothetical protein
MHPRPRPKTTELNKKNLNSNYNQREPLPSHTTTITNAQIIKWLTTTMPKCTKILSILQHHPTNLAHEFGGAHLQ